MRGKIYPGTENFIGGDGQPSVSPGEIIQAAGEFTGVIIDTLSSVKDRKLRRQFEERIMLLDRAEQKELNDKLLNAQNLSERRTILAQTLSATNVARIQGFSKKDMNIALWVFGGVVILGSIFFIYKKFKK